jgi:hypothetical protein
VRAIEARKTARRGSASQRGLGAEHRRERQQMLDDAGPITHCPRCHRPITPQNPITGEHGTPRAHGGSQITSLICRSCNSTAGGSIRRRRT